MNELFEEIQAFLHEQAETSEEQTYEEMLADFYHVPSYVERFRQGMSQELEP